MRSLPLLAAVICPLFSSAAERSFIHEYFDAAKIEKSDPAGATEGMIRSFRLAVSAGNADYATSAGLKACYLIHNGGKLAEAGKLAREVIDAIEPLPANFPDNDALRRAQLFGFVQSGLLIEGRIGEAWRSNRAVAEILRGKKVSATADGPPITAGEVPRLKPELRSLGWRLVRQESELLDIAGRTVEARALLDEAAALLGDDLAKLPPFEQFYGMKLLASRAEIIDFLGYQREAIRLQRELIASGAGNPNLGLSYLNLQINLLRNLSQWDGPSEEILNQVRKLGGQLKSNGAVRGFDRLLAKMELDLRASQEALATLRDDVKNNAGLGHLFERVYAERDLLVGRSHQGEENLDGEFSRLLATMRSQGNKRGEPGLYREYGDYLMDHQRPAEAIVMFTEALRLTRSFGWTLHEPAIISVLFNARFATGDLTGARATLAELEDFLKAHPELPDSRRVPAEIYRAIALAKLGNKDGAKAALALAHQFAKDLPAYKKQWLAPEVEAEILQAAPASTPAKSGDAPPLRVQPLEVVSMAAPGSAARTRFTIFNPAPLPVRGEWKIAGPGALADPAAKSVGFDAAKPAATVRIPASVSPGDQTAIEVSLAAAAGVATAQVGIAWENAGQAACQESAWNVTWDPAATGSMVLDASCLEANPFRYVPLFHELAVPLGEDTGIPFRLRSPEPLRFEYYDAGSQQLLAIDANGNGDFTETGDLHVRGQNGIAAAFVPVKPDSKTLTVEVHIFAPDGNELLPGSSTLLLEAEVYRNGAWAKEAENTLK
jgi:hypothetical protein